MADTAPIPDPVPPPSKPDLYPGQPWYYWKRLIPTNWQSILTAVILMGIGSLLGYLGVTPQPIPTPPIPVPIFEGEMGWHEPTDAERAATLELPNVYRFEDTPAAEAANVFGDDNGNAYLWKLARKSRGGKDVETLDQSTVGSCVGHGWATGINYSVADQAALDPRARIDPMVFIAPEVVYGGSRVNANGGRSPLIGDGSNGSWANKFVTSADGGCVTRGKYGEYDVSSYSTTNCRSLGRLGIKGELLAACKKNVVGSTALMSAAADVEKSLKQGYPVAVCSNVGYAGQSSRDADGFLQARGTWGHCMCIIGYRADRRGFYIMNSWGKNWVGGPNYPVGADAPPDGGFWAAWEDIDRMMKQRDSYAISNVKGFPRQNINPDAWIVRARPLANPDHFARQFGGLYALAP